MEQKSPDIQRCRELGEFFRRCRERTKPEDVGLPSRARARTPGLRREDVSQLAQVSISWYTWLEQGRDIHVSAPALQRICKVFSLSKPETRYAFSLAGSVPPNYDDIRTELPAHYQRVLDAIEYIPAYVVNQRWDRIGWNDAALAVLGDFSKCDLLQRNTLWRTFSDKSVREHTEDWERMAQLVLAEFVAATSSYIDEPWMKDFIAKLLAASPEFREWWPRRKLLPRHSQWTNILHPQIGKLRLEFSTYTLGGYPDLTMNLITPIAEEDTPQRLKGLIDTFKSKQKNRAAD